RDRRGRGGVRREPGATRVVALRQVHEDRGAVGDHHVAVLEHRHLTERARLEERGGLVRSGGEIDVDELDGELQDRREELDAMAVARERVAMDTQRTERRGHGGPRGSARARALAWD